MLADHVLYIDTETLIVDKPAGLPVDPPRDGGISVQNHIQALMLGYKEWPSAVHRLDRDTSGCLMLGRSTKAHKRLALAFEQGLVAKRYLAILDGVPDSEGGIVDFPLGKTSTEADGWRMVPDPAGKAARTAWQVLSVVDGRALVAFTPATGRTHQLRVHAAASVAQGGIGGGIEGGIGGGIGHAIVGDPVYGTSHAGGMMLHASDLSLAREKRPLIVGHAPFPARFVALGFADPDKNAFADPDKD